MKNIILTGMMGSGKTTIANLLGEKLSRQVIDTDDVVVELGGMSIAEMFSVRGEEFMRKLETESCRLLSEKEDLIIATGGGLPMRQENRDFLRGTGIVVFLNRDPGVTYDTMDRTGRPLAQQGRDAFVQRFLDREPTYRGFSHIVINDFSCPENTVAEILQKLEDVL